MSVNTIQYAFAAGEISKTFYGRQDLEKYDLGLELARNWFIDYRGGLSTRPGSLFRDFVQHDDKATKFFEFRLSLDDANTYVLLIGDHYLRFLQNGGYVLEEAKVITGVNSATPAIIHVTAHGYATGDWVKIAGRTFEVGGTTTDTFDLLDPFGNDFNPLGVAAILGATSVQRIYTLETPWEAAALEDLTATQNLNEVRFTNWDYRPRLLIRNDHADWTLSVLDFENSVESPADLAATGSPDEDRSTTIAVTAIDIDGNESLPFYAVGQNLPALNEATENIGFTWTASVDAVSYNIYRGQLIFTDFTSGQEVGYIGSSRGVSFVDNGILPDFSVTPPRGFNPFADGAITRIVITAPGSGYTYDTTVSITDAEGHSFVGFPSIKGGEIESVMIINGGRDYVAPTVVFTDSVGTGATATAETTEAEGNNPALFAVFQQRGVYAATRNAPNTLWGSIPGSYNDFSYSEIVVESDSYSFTIDSREIAPIRHLLPSRGGMLVMAENGVWLLTGGNETAVSPINALADPQTYTGVSKVVPISIGPDILYVEERGSNVNLLSYNDFSRVYGGISVSILANHLFRGGRTITSWTFAETPSSVVWAVRSDGAILPFTFLKEQQLYAWTQCWTRGLYLDALAVPEDQEDVTYLVVQRYVNGRWTKMIETFASRDIEYAEDAVCVDSALQLGTTTPSASLSFSGVSGEVTVTAGASVFTADDVGKVMRAGGGKGEVTEYLSGTQVKVYFVREITEVIPETSIPLPAVLGAWTLDTPVTSISGLWHLEGESVSGLADGNVVEGLVVADGAVTLPVAATRVTLGLPFRCVARSLPMTVRDAIIEDKRERIVGAAVRMYESRGLKIGTRLDRLEAFRERTTESFGEPILLQTDMKYKVIESNFDINGQIYFVQDYPLPANVLGFVTDFEVGDDQD